MQNIKSKMAMLCGLAMMMDDLNNGHSRGREFEPDTIPVKKRIPNGCKEYRFYGQTVVAISEKSAIKKCKKLAGIK